MDSLRGYIRKTLRESMIPEQDINEVRGLSNLAVELYEKLFNIHHLTCSKSFITSLRNTETYTVYEISRINFIKEFPNVGLGLKISFANSEHMDSSNFVNFVPILDARINLTKNSTCFIYIVLDKSVQDWGLVQIKDDVKIKQVIIHEITHLLSNYHNINSWKTQDDAKKSHYMRYGSRLMNPYSKSSNPIQDLFYYISKDELNSVIAQISSSGEKENNIIYQLFLKFKNMSFEEFNEQVKKYNPRLNVSKKLYLKIMDRIKYFFRKADRTFTSSNETS